MLKSFTTTAAALITAWQETLPGLKAAKVAVFDERRARDAVVAHVFENDPAGTYNFDLAGGWKLKFVNSTDYKLDKSPVDPANPTGPNKTEAMLDKLAASGNEGAFIADRLVKWTPELSITEYKKLTPDQRKIVDEVLTTKASAPELSLVEPPK